MPHGSSRGGRRERERREGGGGDWSHRREQGRLPERGFLFFGDSFARLFTLVNHPDIGVKAYKGGSAKGLTKEANENRLDIAQQLVRMRAASSPATPVL